MFSKRIFIKFTIIVGIASLVSICTIAAMRIEDNYNTSMEYEIPIYKIPVSENTQRIIWEHCQNNNLSYELVLAIYQTEGKNIFESNSIKEDIEKFAYYRDYWNEQGFPDEIVFNLMLLSREKGIEGCEIFIKDNNDNYFDDYVQKVTEYKFYLELINGDNETAQI